MSKILQLKFIAATLLTLSASCASYSVDSQTRHRTELHTPTSATVVRLNLSSTTATTSKPQLASPHKVLLSKVTLNHKQPANRGKRKTAQIHQPK